MHRVDALTKRISSAAKVHVSQTYSWSQQNDEYHRCHTWENTESSNLASEVRWRKSRPATTGGIWSLLSNINRKSSIVWPQPPDYGRWQRLTSKPYHSHGERSARRSRGKNRTSTGLFSLLAHNEPSAVSVFWGAHWITLITTNSKPIIANFEDGALGSLSATAGSTIYTYSKRWQPVMQNTLPSQTK
jgi:hypothetical protein